MRKEMYAARLCWRFSRGCYDDVITFNEDYGNNGVDSNSNDDKDGGDDGCSAVTKGDACYDANYKLELFESCVRWFVSVIIYVYSLKGI